MKDYDLIVVGAGSGGVRLARTCASMGANVAIVEKADLGGACVNVGCVPKKLFVYGSQVAEHIHEASSYGWDTQGATFDWDRLRNNKNNEIARLNGIYGGLLDNAGVTLLRGHARISDKHEVTINGDVFRADHIVLSTGSWPFVPQVPGHEHILTSNDMFFLDRLPETAVIWGGGYIGLEFAGILNGLGVEVTVINRSDRILQGFDEDVQDFVAQEMMKKGVTIRTGINITAVIKTETGVEAVLNDGSILSADMVMAATGRKARTQDMGLEDVGVELTDQGYVGVTDGFQTSIPSIYAIGDMIGTPQLTPVALEQAMVLARRLFGGSTDVVDYDLIPSAVFCQPNVGTVGMTQSEAQHRGLDVEIYRADFRPMKYTMSGKDTRCLMKLVVERSSQRVIGAHMVGDDAGETIQGLAVAMRAGATKSDFDRTIGIHPTSAEEFVTMRTPISP